MAALSIGGSVSYWLGVTLLKDWAAEVAEKSPIVNALRTSMARDGAKVSALLRTSLPASMVNYGMAAAGCKFGPFVLGLIGHLPWTVLYSWIGCSIEELSELQNKEEERGKGVSQVKLWGTIVAAVATALILTWVGWTSVQRILKAELDAIC